jgi:septin family protein
VKDLEDLTEGMKDGEYLVYGQEVDDFLTIDKNQLFALTTSGLQALDAHQQALANQQQSLSNHQQALANQQQAQETRVQELEHQLQEEREQNKTTLHRILQRISSLEAM